MGVSKSEEKEQKKKFSVHAFTLNSSTFPRFRLLFLLFFLLPETWDMKSGYFYVFVILCIMYISCTVHAGHGQETGTRNTEEILKRY